MKKIYTIIFLFLIVMMLYRPEVCLLYSLQGLKLWFEKMVPALFPFMILSGVIIKMNLTGELVAFFAPVLQLLFRVNHHVIYGILIGFLCGFPMGAKVATQLLESGLITRSEAEYLLCFCNNIGPIYFVSFVLPAIGVDNILIPLCGMYGVPFCYGLVLRHTVYRQKISFIISGQRHKIAYAKNDLLYCVDAAIKDGINSIVILGGYMIVFNALNLVPELLIPDYSEIVSPILEITGGIGKNGAAYPFYVLCLLPLGGLSCIAQTYSIIRTVGLSLQKYLLHKFGLSVCTVLFYMLLL